MWAAFPHRPRTREEAGVHGQLGCGQPMPARLGRCSWLSLCARAGHGATPAGAVYAGVSPVAGGEGVGGREGLETPAWLPWEWVTQKGEGTCLRVLLYVLIPATFPLHCPTATGNLGGKQSLESGNRAPNKTGGAMKVGSTCPE